MIRYIEYLYLAAAVGVSGYFAANFKTLPTSRMIFLDELDARDAQEARNASDDAERAADNKDETEQP